VNIISYETWRARSLVLEAAQEGGEGGKEREAGAEAGGGEGAGGVDGEGWSEGVEGGGGRGGAIVDGKGQEELLADKEALANFFARLESELEAREYATTEEKRRAIFPKIRNVGAGVGVGGCRV